MDDVTQIFHDLGGEAAPGIGDARLGSRKLCVASPGGSFPQCGREARIHTRMGRDGGKPRRVNDINNKAMSWRR